MSRILVVEDSPTQAKKSRMVLEEAGHEVNLAGNGEIALRMLGEDDYDLVISDVNMPVMDGFELCRQVRADARFGTLPLVLMTAQDDLGSLVRGLEAGASDFVSKPWTMVTLRSRVASVLREDREVSKSGQKGLSHERMFRLLAGRTAELEEAHQDLANHQGQLRETNRELATEREALMAARDRLQASVDFKSKFLATMSHELRTPLNAILGFSELLIDRSPQASADQEKVYLSHIHESGAHLLQLINDILDVSKIEAGKFEIDREPVVVSHLVEDTVALIEGMSGQKSIAIDVELPREVVVVGDASRLKQVLLNLLSNAIKFSPAGGRVVVTARADYKFGYVDVQDNGVGIRTEDQERVFEEFQQVSGAGDAGFNGTGLGLSLSRRLVELHGGSLTVESTMGQGSTFTFSVPIAAGLG